MPADVPLMNSSAEEASAEQSTRTSVSVSTTGASMTGGWIGSGTGDSNCSSSMATSICTAVSAGSFTNAMCSSVPRMVGVLRTPSPVKAAMPPPWETPSTLTVPVARSNSRVTAEGLGGR